MRALTIKEEFGLVKVETSDGKRASAATLPSAMTKLFGERAWNSLEVSFLAIKASPDKTNVTRGRAGA